MLLPSAAGCASCQPPWPSCERTGQPATWATQRAPQNPWEVTGDRGRFPARGRLWAWTRSEPGPKPENQCVQAPRLASVTQGRFLRAFLEQMLAAIGAKVRTCAGSLAAGVRVSHAACRHCCRRAALGHHSWVTTAAAVLVQPNQVADIINSSWSIKFATLPTFKRSAAHCCEVDECLCCIIAGTQELIHMTDLVRVVRPST